MILCVSYYSVVIREVFRASNVVQGTNSLLLDPLTHFKGPRILLVKSFSERSNLSGSPEGGVGKNGVATDAIAN